MRLKIRVNLRKTEDIPFNYQYQMHSALYSLIKKSSSEYSTFLHDTGFIDEKKNLKLFTFSKCNFPIRKLTKYGFSHVNAFELFFSTPIEKSYEHLVLGIFSDQTFLLNFGRRQITCFIEHVETLPIPKYSNEMMFTCLSPIAVACNDENYSGKHYLDYMKPNEKTKFVQGIEHNLIRKYRVIKKEEYTPTEKFEFAFDPVYIVKRQGKIKKNISFKDNRIIAMEAPFAIQADSELIRIGYECGFGSENSAGFGMVEVVKDERKKQKVER